MGTKLKGLNNLRTAQKGGLRSRPRRPDDGLNELAQLMREQDRLASEQESCEKRLKWIQTRLTEIADMVQYLRGMEDPLQPGQAGSPRKKGEKTSSGLPRHVDQVTLRY